MNTPHIERLPYWRDSRALYAELRELPWPVWLDSGYPASGGGRFDVIAADPYQTLVVHDGETLIASADGSPSRVHDDPLALLRSLLGPRSEAVGDLPFCGGAIGFLGYDLARSWTGLPPREGMPGWPTMAVGLYDWAVVVDHARQRSWFVRQGRDPRQQHGWQSALRRLLAVRSAAPRVGAVRGELVDAGMHRAAYGDRFARIQRYIHDGDCYQVNFAQRFRARTDNDAWSLYQYMREQNPAPYGALLELPFGQLLSSSPEQFLGLHNDRVTTRPIKGTRPRGATAADDVRLRAQLLDSVKDRAENLMIVDLLRNDLGKVCTPGSIEVPALFQVESFATVHHLVSTVQGRLAPGHDALDLVSACFPGGSVTGAPKRRAMQIIDELEPERREAYCGSILRLGFDGRLDSSIAIRTALLRDGDLFYWAGGGIVADSVCDDEYQESLDKAAAFLQLVDRG
ncbi:MAG: aminodeoxychorismate synthase component I [Gammaproteobacteria bacterium]|nr:aminodeoxychorismate synthase component I [Gammaproteobacteria bacterium]